MKTKLNTIIVSDIHIGRPECDLKPLITFLKESKFKRIIFNGDTFDFYYLKNKLFLNEDFFELIRLIMKKKKKDQSEIIFIVGNHDTKLKSLHFFLRLFGFKLVDDYIYTDENQINKVYITHGQIFDAKSLQILYKIGSKGYDFLLFCNKVLNKFRGYFGMGYYSFSEKISNKVNNKLETKFLINVKKFIIENKHNQISHIFLGHTHTCKKDELLGVEIYLTGDYLVKKSIMYDLIDNVGKFERRFLQ